MKVDERYFCFGCGATGDAIDLTAKLLGLRPKEAALRLAADFNIPTEPDSIRKKLRRKPMPKRPNPKNVRDDRHSQRQEH
jgi:DNA primase